MKRLISVVGLAVWAAFAFGQVDPNRIVATVNGEEIKGAEYYGRMEFLPGVGKTVGDVIVTFPPGLLTLDQLVTEKLVFQLAKQKGVTPSDLEVQDELAARIRETPNLIASWKATGRTEEELNYQIRFQLAQFNLETAGVTITDFEVQDYYNKNPDMFTIPKQIKLRVIMVRSPEDQATVDKELAAKKEFADVAIAHSAGDNASKGGEYGTVPVTNLGPKLKGLIENTKIGQETDWITENTTATDTIYLKFHIDDILPAQLQPLDPDLKRTIRRKMMAMKGSIKNDIRKEMSTARTQAKIVIQDKTVAAAYQEYIEKYLKQNGG